MMAKKKKIVKVAKPKKAIVIKKNTKSSVARKAAPLKKKAIVKKKSIIKKKPITKKQAVTKKTTVKKSAKKIVVKKPSIASAKNIKSIKKIAAKKITTKKQIKPLVKKKPSIELKKKKVVKTIVAKPIKKEIKALKPVVVTKLKKEVAVQKPEVVLVNTQKTVKIGVKTRKQLVAAPPQRVIEVSNHPKTKVKTLLISQPKPENDKNPYYDLSKKYNLIETFRQFIRIEGLPVKDFRNQRIDILEHKAVILTSRLAVDHYFRMCNEMRVTVPESMKYFCINEATAYYLQKYIQYRKRKIFFGHQTIRDLVDVIRKNRDEKFLLPASDVAKEQICDFLDALGIKYTKAIMYSTVSANLSDIKNLNDYDLLAFFTPAGINSLKQNFPNFKQGNTRIACFGATTADALKHHGYRLDVYAPNPKNPSMSGAIDDYLKEANKR